MYFTPKDLTDDCPCAACEMEDGALKASLCGDDMMVVVEIFWRAGSVYGGNEMREGDEGRKERETGDGG